jgi:hypothetical protein
MSNVCICNPEKEIIELLKKIETLIEEKNIKIKLLKVIINSQINDNKFNKDDINLTEINTNEPVKKLILTIIKNNILETKDFALLWNPLIINTKFNNNVLNEKKKLY